MPLKQRTRSVGWRLMIGAAVALSLTAGQAASAHAEDAAAGESLETAIAIDAGNEFEGVQRENEYLAQHYPNWSKKQQSLRNENGRIFDQIDIVAPDGMRKSVFFDITEWFGKL